MKETSSYYHCRRCDPICLRAWTCKEAHEFASSAPRARRASAPSRVFIKFDLSPWKFTFLTGDHANIDSNRPETPLKQRELKAASSVIDPLPIVSSQSPYMPVDQTDATAMDLHRDCIDDIDTDIVNGYAQREAHSVPEASGGVATATRSVWDKKLLQNNKSNPYLSFDQSLISPLLFAQSTIKQVEYDYEQQNNSAMGLKLSRRTFNVGPTDKMPSFHHDDTHEHARNDSRSHDNKLTTTPINSAQHFPPLRRKNRLRVMPCVPAPDPSEPIAFSLTLHHSSPPTSSHVGKKSSQKLGHSHTRAHSHESHPQSISSGSGDPVILPMTQTYQRSPPPTSSSPKISPVRLGHPNRPYYTAIRKNPATPSRSRPQSQPPPPSYHLGFSAVAPMTSTATVTNPSRHLSMSAMPPAFSDDDNGDFEVHSGPTNSARLSLSSNPHRQSYDNRTQTHTRNAQSLSRAAEGIIGNRSNGFGFSMSGETELRMALAASSPSSVATSVERRPRAEDNFRFRETVNPSQNMNNNNRNWNTQNPSTNTGTDYLHTRNVGSEGSFMGRVKKLRKGLKEMLLN